MYFTYREIIEHNMNVFQGQNTCQNKISCEVTTEMTKDLVERFLLFINYANYTSTLCLLMVDARTTKSFQQFFRNVMMMSECALQ